MNWRFATFPVHVLFGPSVSGIGFEGVTVKPVDAPSRARTNSAQTHSIWSPVSATNGSPLAATPVIWLSSTRARAVMLGRLSPNAPATVPRLLSRTITSVQIPPFGLIAFGGNRHGVVLARVAAVRVVGVRGARRR